MILFYKEEKNMKLIDITDYNMRLSDRDEIAINEMPQEIKNYYFKLYSLYMDLFIRFLIIKTTIKKYDEKLSQSNLNFIKCKSDDLDFYQNFSEDYLNYYYLRNNLYIYRLNKEENEFLKSILISQKIEMTENVISFIEQTYKKVIFEKVMGDNITEVNYATNNLLNLASNNSLVIGVRYNEFGNNLEGELWMDNYLKQKELLNVYSLNLSNDIEQSLKCNCAVFEYTDESIKKKLNMETFHK